MARLVRGFYTPCRLYLRFALSVDNRKNTGTKCERIYDLFCHVRVIWNYITINPPPCRCNKISDFIPRLYYRMFSDPTVTAHLPMERTPGRDEKKISCINIPAVTSSSLPVCFIDTIVTYTVFSAAGFPKANFMANGFVNIEITKQTRYIGIKVPKKAKINPGNCLTL